ncbi:MAG: amidohydrolase family protein, partial [Chloroflexota bacterium]
MPVIDADTHVDESEATWEYLDEGDRRHTPSTLIHQSEIPGQQTRGFNRYWLVGGQMRLRRVRDDKRTGTVQATRELTDVPARLRHMDEMGVDVHVMYPTLFLAAISGQPEVELALCKAYNRWVAARSAESNGRLRWIAVLPTLTIEQAVEEIKFAKDHGAVGVMKKGIECGSRPAGDPYFYPLYQAANDVDIALCIHLGSGDPTMSDFSRNFFGMWPTVLPVVDSCNSLVFNGVPDMFPRLRVGFIEAGASWVPYVLSDLQARHKRISWIQTFDLKQDLF